MRVVVPPIDSRSSTLRLEHRDQFLSWAEVASGLGNDPALRAALTEALLPGELFVATLGARYGE